MQKFRFCLFVLSSIWFLSLASVAFCQSPLSDPGAKRMCAAVKDVPLPARDQPNADEKQALANCVSRNLYFGFGQPADPVQARKCAYVEMEQGKDDLDIAGRAILMMVYANGKGVDRNLDVALKLACEMPGTPADVAGNIYELQRFKNARAAARFDVCDHSAGRHLYKSCAVLQDNFDGVERAQKISAITNQWSATDRKAFEPLHQAAQKFFQSRAASEIDLNHTFQVQEDAFMEDDFIAKVGQLQQGELPKFSAAELRKFQADLQQVYAATQKDPNRRWGTATVEGVRQTQQLWIAYADAWVKFGRKKYPLVSADSWRTWLIQERVAMLQKLLP